MMQLLAMCVEGWTDSLPDGRLLAALGGGWAAARCGTAVAAAARGGAAALGLVFLKHCCGRMHCKPYVT
jgi:hypothetical protein